MQSSQTSPAVIKANAFVLKLHNAGFPKAQLQPNSQREYSVKVEAPDTLRAVVYHSAKRKACSLVIEKANDIDRPAITRAWEAAGGNALTSPTETQRITVLPINGSNASEHLQAYSDGSYLQHNERKACGFAVILVRAGNEIHRISGTIDADLHMRNVAGEIKAVTAALDWALQHQEPTIEILHDYLGIASWINGTWKTAKDRSTQAYIQQVRAIQADGKLKITFTKVKAHTGILFNEIADCLAQTAARQQLATSS